MNINRQDADQQNMHEMTKGIVDKQDKRQA